MFAPFTLLYRNYEKQTQKYPGQVTPAAQKRTNYEVKTGHPQLICYDQTVQNKSFFLIWYFHRSSEA